MLRNIRDKALIFIFVSFLIHISLWTGLRLSHRPDPAPKKETIEIALVEPTTEPKKRLQKKSAIKKQKQQIVEQSKKAINDEKSEDARFLSRHNQKVIEETRAARSGKFTNTAKPGARKSGSKQKTEQEKQRKVTRRKDGEGTLPKLADLKPQFNPKPYDEPDVSDRPPGDPSQTDDYLKDVKQGMQTLLSTREFVYYSYYSRIKEKIRQTWKPKIREKIKMMYRKGRSIASTNDHITQVIITLDKKGFLINVEVVTASGVNALDEAAIEAFQSAAPFPNPPKGIVEQDGRIRIRWDFILEASSIEPLPNQQPEESWS